jgi:glycosyltransferase involved in cell wall biosynthesis
MPLDFRTARAGLHEDDVTRDVVVIAGKDPTLIDGGAESYLRAYGRAAMSAGYMPHHFCVSDKSEIKRTEFGMVHRTRSPFRPFRGLMVAAHQHYIVSAVERFIGEAPSPVLIHSFGGWGGVGETIAERLRRRDIQCSTLITAFGTYAHETKGKLRGLNFRKQTGVWLRYFWELIWTHLTVSPSERRGYRGAAFVLVNYGSVEQIITRQFGPGIRFKKMTYASEMAFLRSHAPATVSQGIDLLQPKEAPLVVAVSRHDPRKGLEILLRALGRLRMRGVGFRAALVGGGSLLDMHRELAKKLDLSDCVLIAGRVADAGNYRHH